MVETLREGTAAYGDLFNAAAIEDVMQRHLARKANLGYHLWGLLILFLWMKKWEIQTAARTATQELTLASAGS
jgi:asparagine synthase (glutamine-hydrolysing)